MTTGPLLLEVKIVIAIFTETFYLLKEHGKEISSSRH
jgi:hypothetical protein